MLALAHPKAAALHLGATVHQTLRVWNRARWQGTPPSLASMYTLYEEAWIMEEAEAPVAWDNLADREQQKQTGWRLLETFFRETELLTIGKPEGVEVAVEADLTSHGLPRLVRVLNLVQDGRLIDFKTVDQTLSSERSELLHGIQISACSLLYRENTGQAETAVELHHLVNLRQPRLLVVELPPATEAQFSRLYRLIESCVRGVERQDCLHLCACWWQQ